MKVIQTTPVRTTSLAERVSAAAHAHPLDDLSAPEVARAAAACRAHAAALGDAELRFNSIALLEPPKRALLAHLAGSAPAPPRLAKCTVLVPSRAVGIDVVVELKPLLGRAVHGSRTGDAVVVSWRPLDGVHPMTTPDDNDYAEAIMKADPEIRRLVAKRYGITDPANLACDTWACHNAPAHLQSRRLMQGFLYGRLCPGDNEYAHPLDIVPIVDLNEARVVHIDMADGAPPKMPSAPNNYHSQLQRTDMPFRTDLKPLHVTQPAGPSFTVEGNLVSWQKWKVRIGFNPREGLVLHQVGYEDHGRVRPVLHRMSLVEMAVPYGDPSYMQARKSAFDVGDYGFGFCANSLKLGCDCLGHIKYFDGVVNDARGNPVVIKNAVCLHEEDAGIMWKHTCVRTGHVEVRRARKLVFQQISTFMNYEYIMSYNFFQDGHISFEAKLSGILSTSLAPQDGSPIPSFGIMVSPGVMATVHQHFFCVRIDPAIDDDAGGKALVVAEVQARALPEGPSNPYGNAFIMAETQLTSTKQAVRDVDFGTTRFWSIKNPGVINRMSGKPVAYKLVPGPTPRMMMAPSSLVYKRARFATHNLWVTPHHDEQRYPAGEHVVQSTQCMGLSQWVEPDASLAPGADPVIWYSFGVTHAPRVEDFPVMPVEVAGFELKPHGFFECNPAVDLPPEKRDPLSVEYGAAAAKPPASGGGGGGSGGGMPLEAPACLSCAPAAGSEPSAPRPGTPLVAAEPIRSRM
ncbi:hypothetical protein FOA52_008811 [Chlamydomonas sp. UWO 241]|nr:hypothetical protein FOA52_008811 [Chlamydomonas sp. UWO 241]